MTFSKMRIVDYLSRNLRIDAPLPLSNCRPPQNDFPQGIPSINLLGWSRSDKFKVTILATCSQLCYFVGPMNLPQALHMLAGRTDIFAVRLEGEVIFLTRNLSIRNLESGVPQKWIPTFGALVGDNWEVKTVLQLQELMQARAGQGG